MPDVRAFVPDDEVKELNTVSECRRHEVTVFASDRIWSDVNMRL